MKTHIKLATLPSLPVGSAIASSLLSLSLISMLAFAESPPAINSNASSCDIYNEITPSSPASAVEQLTQTPNGIDSRSRSSDLVSQVKNFQFCIADEPFSKSKDLITLFTAYTTALDAYLKTDIDDIPDDIVIDLDAELAEKFNIETTLAKEDLISMYLVIGNAYYLGEYVPKNDFKAVEYISQAIKLTKSEPIGADELLLYALISDSMRQEDKISKNNPILTQIKEDTSSIAGYALLFNAGHLDTQTLLLDEEIRYWESQKHNLNSVSDSTSYRLKIISKLEALAEKGSIEAIRVLPYHYEKLADIDNSYQLKADYWSQRYDAIPKRVSGWQ